MNLISRTTTGERAGALEAWILRLGVAAGVLVSVQTTSLGVGTILSRYPMLAFQVGVSLFVLVSLLLIVAFTTRRGLRTSVARLACLIGGAAFFLPALAFRDVASATFSYALAHGCQYYVFMGYVGKRFSDVATVADASQASRNNVLQIVLWSFGLGALLALFGDVRVVADYPLLFGVAMGCTMAHFVIDAGIWRLRDPFPRAHIAPAFDFLAFARPPA